jgi:hypothetical protein
MTTENSMDDPNWLWYLLGGLALIGVAVVFL